MKSEENNQKETMNLFLMIVVCFMLFFAGVGVVSATYVYVAADGGGNYSCDDIDNPATIRITIKFPEPTITPLELFSISDKEQHYLLEMNGMESVANPGEPVLPVRGVKVLLPFNREIIDYTVELGKKINVPGSYQIKPGQEEYPASFKGKREESLLNRRIYGSDTIYPVDRVSKTLIKQRMMGYDIALINLHPIEYHPLSGKISYYQEMSLVVNTKSVPERMFTATEEIFKKNEVKQRIRALEQDRQRLLGYVDNPQPMFSYQERGGMIKSLKSKEALSVPETKLAFDNYQYVIITREEFKNAFQPLIDSKINKGLTATTVTTEWIYDNYSGSRPDGGVDNQTKIRNFIIDAYHNWSTEYVLLGGDSDGADVGGESGDDIVPSRGLQDGEENDTIVDDNIPSDLYYACLDGTFDYDADGIYGEKTDGVGGGEIDLLAEVYVGRAPVDSIYEVGNFVDKTLSYENSTSDYLHRVYLVEEEASSTARTLEAIRLGSDFYGTVGFISNPFFNVTTLYANDTNWSKQDIIDIINSNVHIIHHHGHGWVTSLMKMNNVDVDTLTNSGYFFVYTGACYTGSFDNRGTGTYYYSQDCIAEHLATEPHGAFAYIGPSRYGYGGVNYYETQFWDAVLGEGILNLGKAHQDAKEDNIPYVSSGRRRWSYLCLNLLGDPELSFHSPETVPPQINFTTPTNADGDTINRNWTEVNITIDEPNLDTFKFNWNSTNYTLYDDSLVLALNFNNNSALWENSTHAVDISRYRNDGVIIQGSGGWTTEGRFGGAYEFDGSSTYIDCGNDSSLSISNAITIEMWIKTSLADQEATMIWKGNDPTPKTGWFIGHRFQNDFEFSVGNGAEIVYIRSNSDILMGDWTHAVGTYNGSIVKLYVNGILQDDTANLSGPIAYLPPPNDKLILGGWPPLVYGWNGTIDEVRIYDRALTSEEIWMHCRSEFQKYNSTEYRFYNNVTNLADGTYTYHGWANDTAGNSGQSETRTLNVDTTTTPGVSNLTNQSQGEMWIYWSWTNPSDPDFNHTEIWVNGTFYANVTKPNNFCNVTGLNPNRWYDIQTRTVDDAGNVNTTWVNSTAKTLVDTTLPVITLYQPENQSNQTVNVIFIGYVSDGTGIRNVSLYLDGTLNQTNSSGINDVNYTFSLTMGLGSYSWYYRSCDSPEHCGNSDTWYFTVVTTTTTTTTTVPATTTIGGGNGGGGGGGGGGFSAIAVTKATCFDGLVNCHDDSCEEGVDCGGPCEPCPSCGDGIQNQGEEGIDCGGPCPPCLATTSTIVTATATTTTSTTTSTPLETTTTTAKDTTTTIPAEEKDFPWIWVIVGVMALGVAIFLAVRRGGGETIGGEIKAEVTGKPA